MHNAALSCTRPNATMRRTVLYQHQHWYSPDGIRASQCGVLVSFSGA